MGSSSAAPSSETRALAARPRGISSATGFPATRSTQPAGANPAIAPLDAVAAVFSASCCSSPARQLPPRRSRSRSHSRVRLMDLCVLLDVAHQFSPGHQLPPPEYHERQLALLDQLVAKRPTDPEHHGRLRNRVGQSLKLSRLRTIRHGPLLDAVIEELIGAGQTTNSFADSRFLRRQVTPPIHQQISRTVVINVPLACSKPVSVLARGHRPAPGALGRSSIHRPGPSRCCRSKVTPCTAPRSSWRISASATRPPPTMDRRKPGRSIPARPTFHASLPLLTLTWSATSASNSTRSLGVVAGCVRIDRSSSNEMARLGRLCPSARPSSASGSRRLQSIWKAASSVANENRVVVVGIEGSSMA